MTINNRTLLEIERALTDINTTESDFRQAMDDVVIEVDNIQTNLFGTGQEVEISFDSIRGLTTDVRPSDLSLLGYSSTNTSATGPHLVGGVPNPDAYTGAPLTRANIEALATLDLDTVAKRLNFTTALDGILATATELNTLSGIRVADGTIQAQLDSKVDFDDITSTDSITVTETDNGSGDLDLTLAVELHDTAATEGGAGLTITSGEGLHHYIPTGVPADWTATDVDTVAASTDGVLDYIAGLTFDSFGHVNGLTEDSIVFDRNDFDLSTGTLTISATGVRDQVGGGNTIDYDSGTGVFSLVIDTADPESGGLVQTADGLAHYTPANSPVADITTDPLTTGSTSTANDDGEFRVMTGITQDDLGHTTAIQTRDINFARGLITTSGGTGIIDLETKIAQTVTVGASLAAATINDAQGAIAYDDSDFTISNGVVSIVTDGVDFDELQNIPANTLVGNNTAAATDAIALDASAVRTFLDFTEQAQDAAAALFANGTQSGVTITYADDTPSLSINVADPVITLTGDATGSATMTNLGDVSIDTTISDAEIRSRFSQGNGISISDGLISVTSSHASETVVFSTIAARNAARAAGWNPGDIAVVTATDESHAYVYVGAADRTTATDDSVWVELSFTSGENTTYAFTSGTNGGFTVTPSVGATSGTAQSVTIGHTNISAASSVDGSGGTVVQDVTLDSNGHVTGLGTRALVHSDLGSIPADNHVAHSGVSITAGDGLTGGGTIAATRTLAVGGGTGISVSANAITTNDSEIVHDNLSGFVANEHVNHANININAGTGLTGGGTIAASRTINVVGGTGIVANADNIAIDVATEAEAIAGTDNAHVMTPLRTRDAIDTIVVIEPESNGDPVAADFVNGALFVAQY